MSLGDELDKIREHGSANDKIRVAYESMVGQLGRAEAAGRALKIGDTMPSFLLPNAEGRLVFSDDLLRQGPLVVNFFRGNWTQMGHGPSSPLKETMVGNGSDLRH